MRGSKMVKRIGTALLLAFAVAALLTVASGIALGAEEPYSGNPPPRNPEILPEVEGKVVQKPKTLPEIQGSGTAESRQPESLPTTGADLALYAATGITAVATGVTLVRASRSRGRDEEAS